MQPPPKYVSLSAEQAEVFSRELHRSALEPSIATAIAELLRTYVWLIWSLRETTRSLKRFRQMVFGPSANVPQQPCAQRATEAPGGLQSSSSSLEHRPTAPASCRRGGHQPGQGRLGAEAYVGAKRIACRHDELRVGQRCPVCGRGRLYDMPAGVEMRIDGHALLSAVRYARQKLRCSACGQMFPAALPPEAGGQQYSPRARAVLAIGRYDLGLPLYRVQGYQAMLGVPLPDATQWDQIEQVGDCSCRFAQIWRYIPDCVSSVYE